MPGITVVNEKFPNQDRNGKGKFSEKNENQVIAAVKKDWVEKLKVSEWDRIGDSSSDVLAKNRFQALNERYLCKFLQS